MPRIRVEFSDFSEGTYGSVRDAQDDIIEAHAEGVSVEYVEDADTNEPYSCIWTVTLQKES